jgi:hypothetical protein
VGEPRWEWQEDASREVLVALYLRDALGIVDPSGVPRLRGTALDIPPPPPDPVAWWWMRWWISVVDGRSWPAPPTGGETFDRLVKRHLDAARAYAELMSDVVEVELIADAAAPSVVDEELALLRDRPRGGPSFLDLRIEVLPLEESGVWLIGERTLAVDDRLRADREAYRAAIRPILEQLV